MSPIAPINPGLSGLPLTRLDGAASALPSLPDGMTSAPAQGPGFSSMLDGMVSMVDGKNNQAQALTRQVLLGNSGQLHQSVIALQEASTAFSLMVQVRNKLVDSYQELMRMQI